MVPPVNLERAIFLTAHLGYTTSKFGVGMMMKGLGLEFQDEVAFNSLWPRTAIATNAVKNVTKSDAVDTLLRTPEIMGKAAVTIFKSDFQEYTATAFIDDEVLIGSGQETLSSLSQYNVEPSTPDFILVPDLLI